MKDYSKPLPAVTEEGREYWEGCKRHELLLQQCKECGKLQFPHRTICIGCFSVALQTVKASGKGKVYSFSTVYRAPSKGFLQDLPYTVGLIELDEGPRITSNIVGCKPEEVKIGMKVEVVFEDITDDITLPKFIPLKNLS